MTQNCQNPPTVRKLAAIMFADVAGFSRLMERNSLSRDDARLRLNNQMPIADKIGLADIVIDNQSDVSQTEKKVAGIWQQLKARERR